MVGHSAQSLTGIYWPLGLTPWFSTGRARMIRKDWRLFPELGDAMCPSLKLWEVRGGARFMEAGPEEFFRQENECTEWSQCCRQDSA